MKPILNLNKHPKDCENLSLINAENVKLSNDLSCLQSEEILKYSTITIELDNYYEDNSYIILGNIPCNDELILFAALEDDLNSEGIKKATIFRYNVKEDSIKSVYNELNYYGGKIKGDFTYNVNNELIIAFSEYDCEEDVPLRTINLGKFDEEKEQLSNELLSINPELRIPTLLNYDYVTGNLYKGWYYIFIRYKIDNNDYTQWFDIGGPILISDIEKQSVFKLFGYQKINGEYRPFSTGILDHFNSTKDFSNETLNLSLKYLDNKFKKYQIGFICVNKTNIKSYNSSDIDISINDYIFDLNNMNEFNYQDMIINNSNIFNIKNIINYKNRLYISNYKEKDLNDFDTSNITLDLKYGVKNYNDIKFIKYSSAIDSEETYLTVDEEVNYYDNSFIGDSAIPVIEKDLTVGSVTYNTLIESEDDQIRLNNTSVSRIYEINTFGENHRLKDGVSLIEKDGVIGIKATQLLKILTTNGNLLDVEFYLECYYADYNIYDNIYFKYTINNNVYYARCKQHQMSIDRTNIQFYINSSDITSNILIPETSDTSSLYINTKNSFNERRKNTTLLPSEIYSFYIHFVDKYGNSTRGFKLTPKENTYFNTYINKNGDKLFKIPHTRPTAINFNNKYEYSFDLYNITINEFDLPKDYIGYFLSYEKFEETNKSTGLLTKYDFNDKEYANNDTLNNYNKNTNTKMYFYTSDFDIKDSFELKFNKIRLERKNTFKPSEKNDIVINSLIQNINNLNIPEVSENPSSAFKEYDISEYSIKIAGDPIKNRFGLGTCLELPIIKELFPDGEINLYKVSLLYNNSNIYTTENKELIKFTNVIYPDIYEESNIIQYLNGYCTYNGILIYDNNKFIFNNSDLKVYGEKKKEYIDYGSLENDSNLNTAKFLSYIQMPCYRNFFYETKSFKNEPKHINFKLEEIDDIDKSINLELGAIIEPINSIDLFENKFDNIDEFAPKTYINNRTDITYLSEFDKFVRRSDIIQDESLSNAWRKFGLENYKVISENKGKITNLVGIGTYLLVHTEHSLFAFNNDNTLQTLDKNIQLAIPDIFDIDYRELITSDLGYAGLQDSDAYIVDQFGYIFYDNDSNRLFRFDETKLDYIDTDIIQFLHKYKPNKIRFGHDKDSNRILLNIRFKDKTLLENNKTLSYNYIINKFISFHNYNFNTAINTKNNLYLLDGNRTIKEFDNAIIDTKQYKYPCQLDIIINDNYNIIKQLECIIYKLYKYNRNTHEDYVHYPVEEMKLPYSGEQIRVYNNEVDTGWLDVKIDTEESKNVFSNYDKPHWDLGNWNFNYLRNKLSDKLGLDLMSKLYGNYFIVSIIFGDSNERVEFESLGYNITKDKRI